MLTETWARPESVSNIYFPNFNLASSYSRRANREGGVGIWHHDDVDVQPLDLGEYCIEKHIEVCGVNWRSPRSTKTAVLDFL